jgi:hypothetical protein
MTESADVIAPDAAPEPPPSRRAHILRRDGLLLELVIVTAGVLIALSVDTVRVWRAHQSLAAEARATMLSEVAQNKKALEEALASLGATQKVYTGALRDVRARLTGKRVESGDVNLSVRMAPLSSAAYTTAEITGALGYMKYDDVRRFAAVYEAQRRYQSMQDQFALDVWAILTPMMLGGDPSGARPQELEAWKRGLEQLLAGLMTLNAFGEGLRQSYDGILKPQ